MRWVTLWRLREDCEDGNTCELCKRGSSIFFSFQGLKEHWHEILIFKKKLYLKLFSETFLFSQKYSPKLCFRVVVDDAGKLFYLKKIKTYSRSNNKFNLKFSNIGCPRIR